jgi:hypothetical protein
MADILCTGKGFGTTQVAVSAQTETGRKWLASRAGDILPQSIQYPKSQIGWVLEELADWGCSVEWA